MQMPTPTQRLFGERVRHYRRARGLTLIELAQRIAMTEASMSRIECGRQNVSLRDIEAIAQALDVPPQRLFAKPRTVALAPPPLDLVTL